MISFDSSVCLLWSLWILLFPIDFLFAAISAAIVHELFHIGAILLLGGRVLSLKVKSFGAEIETAGICGWSEAICAVAGPVGSFLLLTVQNSFPLLAFCGFFQGIFNLLPVYPLDGGRFFASVLMLLWPERGVLVAGIFEKTFLVFFISFCVYGIFRFPEYNIPLILCIFGVYRAIKRKKP